ncbi:unnamed protein product [Heligmosomoides polygyrus]|uniref:Reverse transcriptase domain-containing protein n=1 Tax=Heligmosomoides polygyrus TaxID=6339 RepID=A0A183G245_HELPZ|nr:unnamed protein product [Heligmosomoides polygyrus]
MSLTNECLMCNVFKWSGEYYMQMRGLAMGQRLAPVLAVAFMFKVENPVLERQPTLYYRYIDDCFIISFVNVEETVTTSEVDEESFEEIYRQTKRTIPMLYVRGDSVILVSPPVRAA